MTPRARGVAIMAVLCAAVSPAVARAVSAYPGNGSWQPGAARYGEGVAKDQAVVMDDGTRLSADVHYPTDLSTGAAAAGPFPVLVALEPYAKDLPAVAGSIEPTERFVPHGYIYAVVDVRGTGVSGGSFDLFGAREQRDALAVVDWAAALPHSSHKVGMLGASYPALSAEFAAGNVRRGSPLKAIFPIVGPSDVYRDLVFPGGLLDGDFMVPYSLGLELGLDTVAPLLGPTDPARILATTLAHLAGNLNHDVLFFETSELADDDLRYDGAFWHTRDPRAQLGRIARNGVATFVYNAWFDIWERGDARVFAELQNGAAHRRRIDAPMRTGRRADPRFQEAIGPYAHAGTPQATVDTLALEWFDTWLKGVRTGMNKTRTPLHAYEVLGHRWIDAATWPIRGTKVRTYWLAPGPTHTAPLSLNDGALSPAAPGAGGGQDALAWLPLNSPCSRSADQHLIQGPVKGYGDQGITATIGGVPIGIPGLPEDPCFFDDTTLQPGSLTYTTAALERDVDVAGPIGVTLYATSTTTESEWIATADDVAPGGASRPLATGSLLGSMRKVDAGESWTIGGKVVAPGHDYSRMSRSAVSPGVVTRYELEIPAILARIAKGHRLRVTISSSQTPYLLPLATDVAHLLGGVYRVQRTARYPSSINVPTVDPQTLAPSGVDWGRCASDCGS